MKAILINSKDRTIVEVEHNGDYKQIYTLIGADTFDVVGIDDVNSIYVDDEGLLNNPRYFFEWQGYGQPLAGNGLILGVDDEGDTVATNLTVEYVNSMVSFSERSVRGFKPLPQGLVTGPDHPMGPGIPVIGHVPEFGPPEDEN